MYNGQQYGTLQGQDLLHLVMQSKVCPVHQDRLQLPIAASEPDAHAEASAEADADALQAQSCHSVSAQQMLQHLWICCWTGTSMQSLKHKKSARSMRIQTEDLLQRIS